MGRTKISLSSGGDFEAIETDILLYCDLMNFDAYVRNTSVADKLTITIHYSKFLFFWCCRTSNSTSMERYIWSL